MSDRDAKCDDERKALQAKLDAEFEQFVKDRESLTKAETETEKNYDTLLATLASGAIAGTFALMKDASKMPTSTAVFTVISTVALGLCVFTALIDRLLSYVSHKKFRKLLDAEFQPKWNGPGAIGRATANLHAVKWMAIVPKLKWIGLGMFIVGITFLAPGLYVFVFDSPQQPSSTVSPVTVNVFTATQPSIIKTK